MRLPFHAACSALILAAVVSNPLAALAQGAPVATDSAIGYADAADLVLASPVILDATIRSAAKIKGAEAASAAPGTQRFYVTADIAAVLRSPGAMPPTVGYLYDAPLDANGRAPKLKKLRVLAFARTVPGDVGQVQLIGAGAQRTWSPGLDALVRRIAGEVVARDAPPVVRGVGNAFHVPGSLPGEGETQIFLATADGRPVSLSVLRRPGEEPRFAVALSEIVDDAAAAPRRDTLLWYRLACSLPRALPERSVGTLDGADAEQARTDYQFVLESLGPCGRSEGRE
jgi:hypothetical protein